MIYRDMPIHVPLEIRVTGYDNEPFARAGGFSFIRSSIGIINPDGQMLVKLDSEKSYSVFTGGIFPNENTGENYFLAERKRPKKGRLYFVTDYNEDEKKFQKQLRNLENYVLLIDKSTYVFWKPVKFRRQKAVFEIHHGRKWYFNNWKHFYEVKKSRPSA